MNITAQRNNVKEIATSLARMISSPNRNEETIEALLNDLRSIQGFNRQPEERESHDPVPSKQDTVGIWKREILEGQEFFLRDKSFQASWSYWAGIHKINPKKKGRRVVLLGESVARGYFFDPYYTPAAVLEDILNKASGNFEVLDLAKTDLTIDELEDLAGSCLKLKPDAIVIFAGNNWLVKLLEVIDKESIREMATELQDNGLSGLKAMLESVVKQYVSSFVSRLRKLSTTGQVKITFIIPEYNLLDSHSRATERGVSKLPNGGTFSWINARDSAERGLLSRDFVQTCAMANRMISLDPTNPYGYELLAEAQLQQSLVEDARENLEAARDTSVLFRSYGKPKIISAIREAILEQLADSDIGVVDLPEIFRNHSANGIPGRDLFMDYCHLTVEGVQVAMASAAESVLELINDRRSADELKKIAFSIVPKAEVAGRAHIFAAIHNAHYGQGYDIVEYHCRKAVESSNEVTALLTEFVEMATRKTDSVLCSAYENMVMMEGVVQYNRGLLHNHNAKIMDIDLVNAMASALETAGIETRATVNELRKKEHGVSHEKINLLESFYANSSYEKHFVKKAPYLQAGEVHSYFYLIADGNSAVELKIVFRTPITLSKGDHITLKVNDQTIAGIPIANTWKTATVPVPCDVLKDGVNVIAIAWPFSDESFSSHRHFDKIRTPKQLIEAISPVFGEIHQFTAQAL